MPVKKLFAFMLCFFNPRWFRAYVGGVFFQTSSLQYVQLLKAVNCKRTSLKKQQFNSVYWFSWCKLCLGRLHLLWGQVFMPVNTIVAYTKDRENV